MGEWGAGQSIHRGAKGGGGGGGKSGKRPTWCCEAPYCPFEKLDAALQLCVGGPASVSTTHDDAILIVILLAYP